MTILAAGIFTRYVLENPYLLGGLLLLVGALIAWQGLREGRTDRLRQAAIPLVLAVVVLLVGAMVVTPGERGRTVARELVDRVVAEDLVGTMDLFAEDATLHVGTGSIGQDRDAILTNASRLADRFTIEGNRITRLDAETSGRGRATVHVGCLTTTDMFHGTSAWTLEVKRTEDGDWLVRRLVWDSINGQSPGAVRGVR